MKSNKLKIIGLTGNSGSGKSVVAKFLAELGGYIIDADSISREIMQPNKPAYNETLEYFGREILFENGTINRKKLGEIVFSNEQLREKLIDITHKYILDEMNRRIKTANSDLFTSIILDAPLLIEANLHKICNQVWVVYASLETRAERILKRDNCTFEQAYKRFKSQPSFEDLKQHADLIIENEGDLNSLKEYVLKSYSELN